MNKLFLIGVGIVAVFMLKSAFLISTNVTKENIWIIVGSVLLIFLAVRNFLLSSRDQSRSQSSFKQETKAVTPTAIMGVDLKLELILRTVLKNEGKIQAIKLLREETHMGLKEANEFITELEAS
ncbi:MAG: hypothetical protein CME65_08555 [Halobacteriovoraceae bacterium]|nr:hypothetical protein [Halobacteriovoraceae bacterium]|tara:strand:+ start:21 stop:392 length:372 start_codon:yes stop_codon:yes gene_type:complete